MGGTNSFEGYQRSEIILFGPSGAGKTTFLTALARMFSKMTASMEYEPPVIESDEDSDYDRGPTPVQIERVQLSKSVLVTSWDLEYLSLAPLLVPPSTYPIYPVNVNTKHPHHHHHHHHAYSHQHHLQHRHQHQHGAVGLPTLNGSSNTPVSTSHPFFQYLTYSQHCRGLILMLDFPILAPSELGGAVSDTAPAEIGAFLAQCYGTGLLPMQLPLLVLINRCESSQAVEQHTNSIASALGLDRLHQLVSYRILFSSFHNAHDQEMAPVTLYDQQGHPMHTTDPRAPIRLLLELLPDFVQF